LTNKEDEACVFLSYSSQEKRINRKRQINSSIDAKDLLLLLLLEKRRRKNLDEIQEGK
jgi:hypothetical protein